jgi:hypothetical protein
MDVVLLDLTPNIIGYKFDLRSYKKEQRVIENRKK